MRTKNRNASKWVNYFIIFMFKNLVSASFGAVKRTTLLKNMIQSKELDFLMEAHNGLSAMIV